jgi:hypothetical protein
VRHYLSARWLENTRTIRDTKAKLVG